MTRQTVVTLTLSLRRTTISPARGIFARALLISGYDVVTVAGRAFVPVAGEVPAKWWELPIVVTGAEGVMALIGVALLVFGVVRPLVRRLADPEALQLTPRSH